LFPRKHAAEENCCCHTFPAVFLSGNRAKGVRKLHATSKWEFYCSGSCGRRIAISWQHGTSAHL